MSVIGSNVLAGAAGAGGAAGYKTDRSLRFNSADSAYLSRTPSAAGNRRTWTWSGWVKRSKLGGLEGLFGAGVNDYDYTGLYFQGDNLKLEDYPGGGIVATNSVFRDPSSFYHVVLAVDTTLSTAADRVKIYVNGIRQDTTGTYAQNTQTRINKTDIHKIGEFYPSGATAFFNGYLAECILVDGQQLAASDFGEYDNDNNWNPKQYTFSTNPNNGTTWSNGTQSNAASGRPLTNLFDGSTSTLISTPGGANSTNKVTLPASITAQTSVRYYSTAGGYNNGPATLSNSGSTVSTIAAESSQATGWQSFTGTFPMTFNEFTTQRSADSGATGSGAALLEVDGYVLLDGADDNSFHLKFADNSSNAALGTDSSGNNNTFTVHNLTAKAPGDYDAPQNFGVVTYTGNGSTQSISGLNFQPDFVWIKKRNSSSYGDHMLFDTVRGATKFLSSNDTGAEGTDSSTLTAFNSDGFTIGGGWEVNKASDTYVAWCWKAGGTASSNTDGTITSSVSANPSYGFSIVSYSGSGSSGTIGHGLNAVPKLIIVKPRTGTTTFGWRVYSSATGNANHLRLDGFGASSAYSDWNSTNPTSSVFSVDGSPAGTVNASGSTYIAYCFADVTGYQKIGTVTGSGSNQTVTTGFCPQYVFFKATNDNQAWLCFDRKRDPSKTSAATRFLEFNNTNAEASNVDRIEWLADGFKIVCDGTRVPNVSGTTYLYLAIAGVPSGEEDDSLIDTPTNYVSATGGNNGGNYCTLNPLAGNNTLSNGNLDITGSTSGWLSRPGTIGMSSGKWYFEYTSTGNHDSMVGIGTADADLNSYAGNDAYGYSYYASNGNKYNSGGASYGAAWVAGDTIGVAFDADNGTLVFYKNGTSQGTAFTDIPSGTYFPIISNVSGGSGSVNFGQRRSFSYTPPANHVSLCTKNLPDPTIADGSTAFDVALWDGNGGSFKVGGTAFSSLLTASGSGFRSGNPASKAFDGTDSNAVTNDNNGTITFNATGLGLSGAARVRFGIGNAGTYSATFTGTNGTQTDSQSYSSGTHWTSTYNVGTLTSISVTTTAGGQMNLMQIEVDGTVLIDGNGTSLSFSPDFAWIKARNAAYFHRAYDTVRGATKELYPDDDSAENTTSNSLTSFDSSGFTLGASAGINQSTKTYVGWAWDGGDLVTNSAYDQSQAWSSLGSGDSSSPFNWESTFDGDSSTYGAVPPNGQAALVDFSSLSGGGISYSSSVVVTYNRNTSAPDVTVNGSAIGSTADGTDRTYTLSGSGTLTSVGTQTRQYASSGDCGIKKIVVDSKELVDPGIIPAGSLNSSAYNQSHAITSNITSSGSLGGTLANWFNGQRANKLEPSGSGSLDFTGVSALQNFSGTLQFAVSAYSGSTSMKFVINASTDNLTFTTNTFPSSSGGFPSQLLTIPVTSLRTLDFTSISGQSTQFWGMYLNGKLLVDSTATPDNIPAIASTVKANPTAGFSIVSYTGNLSANGTASVAHGLNKIPELIITKQRNGTSRWPVLHKDLADNHILRLDNTDQSYAFNYGDLTNKTSSIFSTNYTAGMNTNGDDFIAYCFTSSDVCSVGSYIGNGSADGPFVYTGFRPAFVLGKRSDAANGWFIFDSKRDSYNVADAYLAANASAAEQTFTFADFLSNGFKLRSTTSDWNGSSGTILYIAFAENPFSLNGGLAR